MGVYALPLIGGGRYMALAITDPCLLAKVSSSIDSPWSANKEAILQKRLYSEGKNGTKIKKIYSEYYKIFTN